MVRILIHNGKNPEATILVSDIKQVEIFHNKLTICLDDSGSYDAYRLIQNLKAYKLNASILQNSVSRDYIGIELESGVEFGVKIY